MYSFNVWFDFSLLNSYHLVFSLVVGHFYYYCCVCVFFQYRFLNKRPNLFFSAVFALDNDHMHYMTRYLRALTIYRADYFFTPERTIF